MKRKNWEKPKLVILVRGTEQEDVLAACKFPGGAYTAGPIGTNDDCQQTSSCTNCSSTSSS